MRCAMWLPTRNNSSAQGTLRVTTGVHAFFFAPRSAGGSLHQVRCFLPLDALGWHSAHKKRSIMARSGLACALMCEAEGEHLHQGLLQRPSHFCVHVRDANGQRLRKGGDRLRVTARGPGQLRPGVTDCGNGRYDVSYLATLSGSYQLAITCNNVPVRGSPFSVIIEPGCAHAPSCTIDAAELAEVVAGERARFTVRAYDECGRPKIMGGETFEAVLVRRRSEHSERSEVVPSPSGLGSEAWEEEARAIIREARGCEDEASWVDEALAEEARWLAAGGAAGGGRATSPPTSPGRRGAPLSISSKLALSPTFPRASEVRGGGVAAAAQAAQAAARRRRRRGARRLCTRRAWRSACATAATEATAAPSP